MKQRTIARSFKLSGRGIHSGKESSLVVAPAPVNSGLVLIKGAARIPVSVASVKKTRRGTTLGGVAVVEHLLAAIYALGIDNLVIEVEGEEIPALDGSALPFAQALLSRGLLDQEEDKSFLRLSRPLKVEEKDTLIEAFPSDSLKVNFMVNFPEVGEQRFSFDLQKDDFLKEIAPARTFGYIEELELLKQEGLAQGASLENALVLGKDGYLNQPRFPDEVVRHKILDLIGDLALLGRPLRAEINAIKSGHKLNIDLVRRLLNNE